MQFESRSGNPTPFLPFPKANCFCIPNFGQLRSIPSFHHRDHFLSTHSAVQSSPPTRTPRSRAPPHASTQQDWLPNNPSEGNHYSTTPVAEEVKNVPSQTDVPTPPDCSEDSSKTDINSEGDATGSCRIKQEENRKDERTTQWPLAEMMDTVTEILDSASKGEGERKLNSSIGTEGR